MAFPLISLWFGLAFIVPVVIIVLIIMLVFMVTKPSTQHPREEDLPAPEKRAAFFREKDIHFQEERTRILGMVENGKISPEEGERLMETLERETTTMACPFCAEEIRVGAVKCRHCRTFLMDNITSPRRLTRPDNRVLAGVCGGLAEYFDLDPTLVRILAALIIFFSGIITGLIVYLIAALIIPERE